MNRVRGNKIEVRAHGTGGLNGILMNYHDATGNITVNGMAAQRNTGRGVKLNLNIVVDCYIYM